MQSRTLLVRLCSVAIRHGKKHNPISSGYQFANCWGSLPRNASKTCSRHQVELNQRTCSFHSSELNKLKSEDPISVGGSQSGHSRVTDKNEAQGSDDADEKRQSYLEARRRAVLKGRRMLSPLERVGGMILPGEREETGNHGSSEQQRTVDVEGETILESNVDVGLQEKDTEVAHASHNTCGNETSDKSTRSLLQNPPMVDGEYIIIARENMKRQEKLVRLVKLDANLEFKCKFGNISHADIIGHQSGSIFATSMDIEVLIRRPSLEEFVLYMKRTPAIAYPKDCCTMLLMIDASPGDTVLEAGSGSGAMTLFLSRAVGHRGKVHSFEMKDSHQVRAKKNFRNWHTSWDISHETEWPQNVSFHQALLEECGEMIGDIEVDGAIIDMESPGKVMATMSTRLKAGKAMAVYVANLTQVIDIAEVIRKGRLPLVMDTVLEVAHKVWVVNPARRHSGAVLGDQRVVDGAELNGQEGSLCGEQFVADEVPKYLARPHHLQPPHTAFLVKIRKIRSSSTTFKV